MNLARCLKPQGKSNTHGKMTKEKWADRNTENYTEFLVPTQYACSATGLFFGDLSSYSTFFLL